MTIDDTNIISDEDFLNEILNRVKPEDSNPPQPKNEIDEILGLTDPEPPQPQGTPEPIVSDNSEGSKNENENENEGGEKSTEEEIKEEEKTSLKRFGVKDTVSTLLENNTWSDMPVKYGDKEYDSILDLIEKEKPNKELFDMLSQAQKQMRDEEINQSYLKIGDKNSTQARLANAILQGIPYDDLLNNYDEVIEPLQRMDFANIQNGEAIAEQFVKQCLIEIDGYHPASVDAVVQQMKQNFQLIDAAEKYQDLTIQNFNIEIERRESERQEEMRNHQEMLKKGMKDLRQELKNQNIPDAFATKVLKLRYNVDPNTGRYHFEELLNEKLQDKAFEAKLMHFLLDEEDFVNKEKAKVKTETSKKYLELMKITPSSKGSVASPKTNSGNLETNDEDFLRDIGLIND